MKLKHFLLTALLLFTGVGGVYATKFYVGFTTESTHTDLQTALMAADANNDTVCVATGLYIANNAEFTVPEGVTLIGGYNKGSITAPRHYPGEFVPFTTSDLSATTEFTILDGNAYKTLPAQKHRVIKVENGGVVDGCLIRNGHIRNGNGGGVLLDGGKLYNSIVRGNVAMSKPDTTIESLGGGVFIQNNGELINCVVAYNMANDGYGVAAGVGGGKMINNTVTANTYAPVFSKIPGTNGRTFQMYKGSTTMNYRPAIDGLDTIPKFAAKIELSDFYLARTETTAGQYAVFCAAIDISKNGNNAELSADTLKNLLNPVKTTVKVGPHYNIPNTGTIAIFERISATISPGLNYADGVWYPFDTSTVEYPMGSLTWVGALAYSVWLGGGLPTEAQWEYAARRNQDGTLSENLYSGAFGSSYDASRETANEADTATWRVLDTIAWVHVSVSIDTTGSGYKTAAVWGTNRVHEVARKRPNAMGLYDMTGNIAEWMADCWNEYTDSEIYTSGKDPINIATPTFRIYRGGAFNVAARNMFFLSRRVNYNPVTPNFGVRPVVAF